MSCHFGRGVLVGGLIGVFAAMNWRRAIENCPVYQRIESMLFDGEEREDEDRRNYRPYRRHRRYREDCGL